MSKTVFKFKQFAVRHALSGMKVGTDGVLLGAWAEAENPIQILDIGTGSGLIALMLAQRFENAKVTGVEIAEEAAKEAEFNFKESPFLHRCKAIHSSIGEFNSEQKFDLIVSNPPYFKWTPTEESLRATARQQFSLDFEELLFHSNRLLSSKGKAAFVIPYDSENTFLSFAKDKSLYPRKIMRVKGNPDAPSKRSLLLLEREDRKPNLEELIIEQSRNTYTEEYISLTRDFYLKM